MEDNFVLLSLKSPGLSSHDAEPCLTCWPLPCCHFGHMWLETAALLSTADQEYDLVTKSFIPIPKQPCVVRFS